MMKSYRAKLFGLLCMIPLIPGTPLLAADSAQNLGTASPREKSGTPHRFHRTIRAKRHATPTEPPKEEWVYVDEQGQEHVLDLPESPDQAPAADGSAPPPGGPSPETPSAQAPTAVQSSPAAGSDAIPGPAPAAPAAASSTPAAAGGNPAETTPEIPPASAPTPETPVSSSTSGEMTPAVSAPLPALLAPSPDQSTLGGTAANPEAATRPATPMPPAPAIETAEPANAGKTPATSQPDTPANRGGVFRDCEDCPEMVVVPGGRVLMGSTATDSQRNPDEGPQHEVVFDSAFAIGKYEITRSEYAHFVAKTNRQDTECQVWRDKRYVAEQGKTWRNPGFEQSPQDPVVCVTWQDARDYANWLAQETGAVYRLPTEAEWEYAARAGTGASRFWGDKEAIACTYANVADQSATAIFPNRELHDCTDGFVYTAPVGHFQPNGFFLFDMLGNVWEWVEDCYKPSYEGAPGNGTAPNSEGSCRDRVLRGGSRDSGPSMVRSASRGKMGALLGDDSTGFRVARSLSRIK